MTSEPPSQLSFEMNVVRVPFTKRSKFKEYTEVFSNLDGLGAIWIVIGDYRKSTALSEVIESIAGVVKHRLLDGILTEEEQDWERLLSEDWRLLLRRRSEGAEIEVKRASRLIPMDDELQATQVEIHQVRDALVGLMEWSIRMLEGARPWIRSLPGRHDFVEELQRLGHLRIN